MKYLILLISLMMFGCSGGKEEAKPTPPFQCIHPAIMGGAPFNLPENAVFLNNGQVVTQTPDGKRYTLVGIICVKVQEPAQ